MADLLQVDILGIGDLINTFSRVEQSLIEEDVVDEAGAILLNRIRTRFLDETDPDGRKWVRSPAAIAGKGKGRKGKSFATLFDTGVLFHSIQLFKRGNDVRAIGTDVKYAPVHQKGLNGNVKRVFLGFNDEDETIIQQLLINRIEKAKNG